MWHPLDEVVRRRKAGDRYDGCTGMQPEDFRELVHGIAAEHGLPLERVVRGGDHRFSCADDIAPLTDDLVADRTARLVRVAEAECRGPRGWRTAGPARRRSRGRASSSACGR